MKGLFKKSMSAALVAAMGLSMMACGSSSTQTTSTTTSSAQESTSEASGSADASAEEAAPDYGEVDFAIQVQGHSMPIYMAGYEGLFEEAGITANFELFTDGSTENEALGSNQWEIGAYGNLAAVAGGIAYGSHIIAASCADEYSCNAWVRADSDIAQTSGALEGYPNVLGTAEQWKGKTILCPTGTGGHYALGKCLELFGLTFDDVEIISMDVAKGLTAFSAGQGDILVSWSPVSYQAEEAGFVQAYSSADLGLVIPCYIVASEKVIQEEPEKVAAALKAIFEAVDMTYGDVDAQAEIFQQLGTEYGNDYTMETCVRTMTEKPIYSLEDNLAFFEGEYGSRPIDEYLYDVIDFCVEQGIYTEEQKQYLIDNNFIDGSFLEMIAE